MKIALNSFIQFVKRSKKTILLIVIVSALTLIISTVVAIWLSNYHNLHFPSIGAIRVVDVEVYGGDLNFTQDGIPFIDWGTVYPGYVANRSLYIRSKSNIQITLNLTLADLKFLNSKGEKVTENMPITPMTFTWNYSDKPLSSNEEIYVTLTLKTSSDPNFTDYLLNHDVKEFNFEILITPVEQQ